MKTLQDWVKKCIEMSYGIYRNWVVYMYDDIVNNNKKEFTVS